MYLNIILFACFRNSCYRNPYIQTMTESSLLPNPHYIAIDTEFGKILPNLGPITVCLRTLGGGLVGYRHLRPNGEYFIQPLDDVIITQKFLNDVRLRRIVPLSIEENVDRHVYLGVYIVQGTTKDAWEEIQWENYGQPLELTIVFTYEYDCCLRQYDNIPADFDAVYAKFAYSHGFVRAVHFDEHENPHYVYVPKNRFPPLLELKLDPVWKCFVSI